MTSYPKWWDTTLTIFNKYQDPSSDAVTWFKFTVPGCFWKYTGNKVTIGETVLESNTSICRIPQNDAYLERYLWEGLSDEEKAQHFTLGIGDIIIKGGADEVIDEYTDGKRSTDILDKYKGLQGCIVIEAFAENVGGGRNHPHYYVSGI